MWTIFLSWGTDSPKWHTSFLVKRWIATPKLFKNKRNLGNTTEAESSPRGSENKRQPKEFETNFKSKK